MKKSNFKKGGGTKTAVFFKKNLGYILLAVSLVIVAGIVTLAVLLSGNKSPVIPNDPTTPIDNVPIVYASPIDSYTMGQGASLDMLVYSETLREWRTHNGIDLICEAGTVVKSIMDGKVVSIKTNMLEGTVITIEHSDGVVSIYKSLDSEEILVEQGANVTKGQPIGKVADTAISEAHMGAHLHLEIKKNNVLVDPSTYIEDFAGK